MKKVLSTLVGASVLTTSVGFASSAQAYNLSLDPACDAAAAVFSPDYDNCQGAYLLEGGENDVTDGEADNIVNQLLNDEEIFGGPAWTFLDKQDTGAAGTYFTIDGIGSTTGTITFDIAAIEADFGPTFLTDYDIAVSFKAARNFSIYQWDAPLGTNVIEWSTAGTATNNRDIAQALSHGSVYIRPVPEPLTILGAGAAISFGTAFKRKLGKSNKNDKKA